MNFIEIMTVTLGVLYLGYVVFERLYFIKIRKSFKHVIHVNGTREKHNSEINRCRVTRMWLSCV